MYEIEKIVLVVFNNFNVSVKYVCMFCIGFLVVYLLVDDSEGVRSIAVNNDEKIVDLLNKKEDILVNYFLFALSSILQLTYYNDARILSTNLKKFVDKELFVEE